MQKAPPDQNISKRSAAMVTTLVSYCDNHLMWEAQIVAEKERVALLIATTSWGHCLKTPEETSHEKDLVWLWFDLPFSCCTCTGPRQHAPARYSYFMISLGLSVLWHRACQSLKMFFAISGYLEVERPTKHGYSIYQECCSLSLSHLSFQEGA